MEPDQVDILAAAVFRYCEQIEDTQKSRLAGQFGSDIRKPDSFDRVDLDFAFVHAVSSAHSDVGTNPDSNTARDLTAANALPKPLGKDHAESLEHVHF